MGGFRGREGGGRTGCNRYYKHSTLGVHTEKN